MEEALIKSCVELLTGLDLDNLKEEKDKTTVKRCLESIKNRIDILLMMEGYNKDTIHIESDSFNLKVHVY